MKDKTTKEPFDPETRLSFQLQEKGLRPDYAISLYGGSGTLDGIRGDHIILAPPYTVSKEEIDIIVNVTAKVLTDVIAEMEL